MKLIAILHVPQFHLIPFFRTTNIFYELFDIVARHAPVFRSAKDKTIEVVFPRRWKSRFP